jgi:hypothetical protein
MLDSGIRESGADAGNGAGLVDKDLVRHSWQRTRERSVKSCDWVDPGWRIKPRRPIKDAAPPLSQHRYLGGGRFNGRKFQESESLGALTHLAVLGTLSRSGGEGGPSPQGWVGEGPDSGKESIAIFGGKPLTTFEARTANGQLSKPPAQRDRHRYPRRLTALGFAANLHQHPLALVEPLAARHDLTLRQESRPLRPDIDEHSAETRHQPRHPAEMNASGLAAVAALDQEFGWNAVLEQRCAPLAEAGGNQQFAAQWGR